MRHKREIDAVVVVYDHESHDIAAHDGDGGSESLQVISMTIDGIDAHDYIESLDEDDAAHWNEVLSSIETKISQL